MAVSFWCESCARAKVLPHLLEFAQDQHGSRFLQGKLDEASPEERHLSCKHIALANMCLIACTSDS